MMVVVFLLFFFFFQAEDGIRDLTVTGVQTCALPIYRAGVDRLAAGGLLAQLGDFHVAEVGEHQRARDRSEEHTSELRHSQISYAVFCLKKKKKKKNKFICKIQMPRDSEVLQHIHQHT